MTVNQGEAGCGFKVGPAPLIRVSRDLESPPLPGTKGEMPPHGDFPEAEVSCQRGTSPQFSELPLCLLSFKHNQPERIPCQRGVFWGGKSLDGALCPGE